MIKGPDYWVDIINKFSTHIDAVVRIGVHEVGHHLRLGVSALQLLHLLVVVLHRHEGHQEMWGKMYAQH